MSYPYPLSPADLHQQQAFVCVATSLISPPNPWKKKVTRTSFRHEPYPDDVSKKFLPSITVSSKVPVRCPLVHSDVHFAFVSFKHTSTCFIAPFRIVAGDTVVVEGDRGEDIGIVRSITTETPATEVVCKVLRRATERDNDALRLQREKEQHAAAKIQTLANSLRLNATVEDVEYQFDLNKLTVFVRRASKGMFVDFRKLQRELFREFRCRIWCAYMDEVE